MLNVGVEEPRASQVPFETDEAHCAVRVAWCGREAQRVDAGERWMWLDGLDQLAERLEAASRHFADDGET